MTYLYKKILLTGVYRNLMFSYLRFKIPMKAILAVNLINVIGLNGGLPWRSREDFKHFQKLTLTPNRLGETPRLLAGFRTYETLLPLKGRLVYLDPRDGFFEDLDLIDWCIGGKKTYEKYASFFTELHISRIQDRSLGDTSYPDFSDLNPSCKIFEYNFDV